MSDHKPDHAVHAYVRESQRMSNVRLDPALALAVIENLGVDPGTVGYLRKVAASDPLELPRLATAALATARHEFFRTRSYQIPAGYMSWTRYQSACAVRYSSLLELAAAINRPEPAEGDGQWSRKEGQGRLTYLMEALDYPFYVVEPELVELVHKTDLAADIRFDELRLPLPATTFLLPATADVFLDGAPVEAITVFLQLPVEEEFGLAGENGDEELLRMLGRFRGENAGKAVLLMEIMNRNGGREQSAVATFAFDPDTGLPEDGVADDPVFDFVFKLLAVVEAQPEIDVPEKILSDRPAKTGKKHKRAVQSRSPRRLSVKTWFESKGRVWTRCSGEGVIIRRGHVRQQAHGPRMTLRKKMWIMPTWVVLGRKGEDA